MKAGTTIVWLVFAPPLRVPGTISSRTAEFL